MSWLMNAIHQSNKPKYSVIGVLKKNLGGQQPGRERDVVHASQITQPDFCPRKWALLDVKGAKPEPEFVAAAMDVTYQLGVEVERMLVEEWATPHVIGDWRCRFCHDSRTMVSKPNGFCKDGRKHWWEYLQWHVNGAEYDVEGGIDAIFDVGAPRLMICECKIMNQEEFDKIIIPLPEHRLRTNLYMKLIAESESPYKDKFNTQEARVLYVSRGYGRQNEAWNEILPFKEFEVKRDDEILKPMLQKGKAVKVFRTGQGMPNGICDTALDKYAKKCSCCQDCFSGDFPPTVAWEEL